jgi:hypothetical protein
VWRSPLLGTREDKELYDEFEVDHETALIDLINALRVVDGKNWWYWSEKSAPQGTRPTFYDPTTRMAHELPESEFSSSLREILTA